MVLFIETINFIMLNKVEDTKTIVNISSQFLNSYNKYFAESNLLSNC